MGKARRRAPTESDQNPTRNLEYYALMALHYREKPDRPQQYQCIVCAQVRLLLGRWDSAGIARSPSPGDASFVCDRGSTELHDLINPSFSAILLT
jgi:hypothetical protein